jgi:hypothetical protein
MNYFNPGFPIWLHSLFHSAQMSKTLPIGALKVNDEVMVCGPHKPLKHQIGVTHQTSDFSDMPVYPSEYGHYCGNSSSRMAI